MFFVITFFRLRLMNHADDVVFSHALDNIDLIQYLHQRYFLWSGRVFIEAIMVSTIKYHIIWRITLPLLVLAMSYLMWSSFMRGSIEKYSGMSLSLLLILCMDGGVAGDSQWWITGFYNYLLPMTCALYIIHTIINNRAFSVSTIILVIFCGLISTSCEQIAIGMIITCAIILIKHKSNNIALKPTLLISLLIIMGATINLLSPGSENRFYIEAHRYMPQILDMNLFEKSIIGVDRLVENISTTKNILFIICCFTFIKYKIDQAQDNIVTKINLFFICLSLIIILIGPSAYMNDISFLTYQSKFTTANFGDYHIYIYYTIFMISLISLAVGTLNDNGVINLDCFLALSIGILVTIAIGLSPTAYASNVRILYVVNICMVIYNLLLIKRIVDNRFKPK